MTPLRRGILLNFVRCCFLCFVVCFAATLAVGQAGLPKKPDALVRSLYIRVLALHSLGIGDTKIFAPYLSKALLHRIDVNDDCQRDWDRQNPDPNAKPPFLEFGLFSGGDERADPKAFHIERTESEKDGSFRVYVRLMVWWDEVPDEQPEIWRVAAVVVREKGHLAVDDVIWLKDGPQDVDVRLSEYLSQGCDGSRWVGEGEGR